MSQAARIKWRHVVEDRRVKFQDIVSIPLLLDAEGCREAIGLADSLEQLDDPELLEHLRAQNEKAKRTLRQVYAARRRQHDASPNR